MMGWWDHITNFVNQQAKMAGIPGVDFVNRIGGDVMGGLNQVVGRGVTDVLGPGGINPYGDQFKSDFNVTNAPSPPSGVHMATSGGDTKKADTTTTLPPPPTATATATTGTQAPNDALTMGLGMFFNQYLAPLMQQQQQANSALIGQYGKAMDKATSHPLPPGVADILNATTPQSQGMMQMMNQAGAQQALGMAPFEQLMQQIGGQVNAQQALQDAYTKWASNVALYGGGSPALSQALQKQFPQGSLGGAMAEGIASANLTAGMGVPGVTGTGTPTTPTPTAAPAPTAPTAPTTDLQTQQYTTQLKALPAAQQKQYWDSLTSDQQAVYTAAGYTPPA